MNDISTLAGAALAAGLLLAGVPAHAEILNLDCDVSVDTYNVFESRDGRDSGSSRGVWKVRVAEFPEYSEVQFKQTAPFGISYRISGMSTDYLERWDEAPIITEDRIEWCPDRLGCDARIPFLTGQGWYSVGRAVIDRRRGTLSLSVEQYDRLAGVQMHYTYYGTCAPEPGRQF